MNTLLKYPGGKNKELKYILPNLPITINRFFEPFVGGGAVYFNMDSTIDKYINDKSHELINFYQNVSDQNNEFLSLLQEIDDNLISIQSFVEKQKNYLIQVYTNFSLDDKTPLSEIIDQFIDDNYKSIISKNSTVLDNENYKKFLKKIVLDKYKRIKNLEIKHGKLEKDEDVINNIETGFYAALYTFLRELFNDYIEHNITEAQHAALYFYIREYCYSSMFRYNKYGKFNVPYGGMSYNHKFMTKKIEYLKDEKVVSFLRNTKIDNMDFYDFLEKYQLQNDDFLFLDPPYDSEFSTYANNTFELNDQTRLANYLIKECPTNFMLVIKNTDYIQKLYPEGIVTSSGRQLNISAFDKNYLVSFRNRNDKKAEHLLITNYELGL